MKAWKFNQGGVKGVVVADTREKAKYCVMRSAVDAGYDIKWNSIKVWRLPQFDDLKIPPYQTAVTCEFAERQLANGKEASDE